MSNPIVWLEIMGNDTGALQSFYGSVFDWTFDTDAMPDYIMIASGGKQIGGLRPGQPGKIPYVQVTDPAASLEEIVAAGGAVVHPATEVPGAVTFAVFADLEGNVVGLVKGE